jgi:hypothetical protein
MLDLLTAAYVQCEIMLVDSYKVLNQDLQCLCRKGTTALSEWAVPKNMDGSLLHFRVL